jgi:acylphosphatase
MSSSSRVHLHIYGRVQGVSFRYYARQRAQSLGLAGWARNSPDGSVEVVVEGPEENVRHFVNWAHQGPSMAQVDRVQIEREEPEQASQVFRIVG